MAWIESHDDIWEHHKTIRLCRQLGIAEPQAVGHLISLWHFVLRNAWETADLSPWGDDGIERAARWNGADGELVKALRDTGWLDGNVAHGWLERAGQLVFDRLRKRKSRIKNVRKLSRTNTGQFREIPGTSASTVPYRTVPNPTVPNPTTNADFIQFWTAYPNKVGKHNAVKAWAKIKPDQELVTAILAAVEKNKSSASWLNEGGKYIPHPATWLNGRRWEDEVTKGQPTQEIKRELTPAERVKITADRIARWKAEGRCG